MCRRRLHTQLARIVAWRRHDARVKCTAALVNNRRSSAASIADEALMNENSIVRDETSVRIIAAAAAAACRRRRRYATPFVFDKIANAKICRRNRGAVRIHTIHTLRLHHIADKIEWRRRAHFEATRNGSLRFCIFTNCKKIFLSTYKRQIE